MSQKKQYFIQLDTNKDSSQMIGVVKKNDTNVQLCITLMQNSQVFDLSEVTYITATIEKQDLSTVNDYVEIVDASAGKIEFDLPLAATNLIGECTGLLQIYIDGESFSTAEFYYIVKDSLLNDEGVTDQAEYPVLTALIGDVETLESNVSTAEAGRVAAEDIRISNEDVRIVSESNRDNAESNRNIEELSRANAETDRDNAESTRQAQETTRQSNESTRGINESTRQNNETIRVSQESNRVDAELSRDASESTRQSQESTRQAQEGNRLLSETGRATAEATRTGQESNRQTNEAARRASEVNRESAESTRAGAETTRIANEADRENAEGIRESNETLRQSAESTRETNTQSRLDEMDATLDTAAQVILKMATTTNIELDDDGLVESAEWIYPDATESVEVVSRNENGLPEVIKEIVMDDTQTLVTYYHTFYYTIVEDSEGEIKAVLTKIETRKGV